MENSPTILPERILEELSKADHKVWEGYKPDFLAEGSERVVFTIPEHPNVVIKVSKYYLAKELRRHQRGEASSGQEETIAGLTAAENEMVQYFGSEHVPSSRYVLCNVPVLPFMTEYVDGATNLPSEVRIVAQIQKKLEMPGAENVYSLSGFFEDKNDEEYASAIIQGVFPSLSSINTEEVLRFKANNTDIQKILGELPESYKAIADFVVKAMIYSKDTGKNLDTMGPENIILMNQNGVWDYTLVDAVFALTENSWLDDVKQHIKNYLANPASLQASMDSVGPQVVLVCSYIRFLNGFAHHLKLPDRLDYFGNLVSPDDIEKLKRFLVTCRNAWKKYSNTPNQALASQLQEKQ